MKTFTLVLFLALVVHSAQASFLSRAMDYIDYSIFQLAHHAKSSKTYRYLSHGVDHLANGKGGQMKYVFDGTGPSQGQTGPSAPKNWYWDGAANQEAYNGGRTGPAYASLGPQAVDGSAICNDRASCKILSEGTGSWGCASSRCYREKTNAMDTCEPDPLKAKMLSGSDYSHCVSYDWYYGPGGYAERYCNSYQQYFYGSNVCKGKYVCEDTLTPANGMWKSCLLPTPSNGNYDCRDKMDDFNNLINGGHCNQMKCDAGFISQGSMSCTCGVNTGDLQCVPDPNPSATSTEGRLAALEALVTTLTEEYNKIDKVCIGGGDRRRLETGVGCGRSTGSTTVEFAVTHKIVLNGMSAAQFQSDPSIVTSFRESAATLLGVETNKIINIVATSTEGESCSVAYDVKVASKEAMDTMTVKMTSTFSDSTAFTTVMKSTMKTNGVTSVAVNDITSDTSSIPETAETSGGAQMAFADGSTPSPEGEEFVFDSLSSADHTEQALLAGMVALFITAITTM